MKEDNNMIKFLVMDVDGTLTDGKIYMGTEGELTKAFNVKDGAGIALLLPKFNITPVIITARESQILKNRCREIGIKELYQASKDKLKTLKEVLDRYAADFSSVAYAGDDLPDIPCMREIKKAGGKVLCPADAIPEIKAMADYISSMKAGDGAIRDCIHYLIQETSEKNLDSQMHEAIDLILSQDFSNLVAGKYNLPNGMEYTIQEYKTKNEDDCVVETHHSHIDIQYIISGCEIFKTYDSSSLISDGYYNSEKDVEYWKSGVEASSSILTTGSLIVVKDNVPHKGAVNFTKIESVKKLVCKIPVNGELSY